MNTHINGVNNPERYSLCLTNKQFKSHSSFKFPLCTSSNLEELYCFLKYIKVTANISSVIVHTMFILDKNVTYLWHTTSI
jgi:hypothetical protein